MSGTSPPATVTERECRGPFQLMDVRTGAATRTLAVLLALLSIGYTKVRWRPKAGGTLTAFDEHRIATVIVVDVAPVRDGYPVPRLSPARAASMRRLCHAYLQDNRRLRRVRADYVVLPEGDGDGERVALTMCRGVAWAFSRGRKGRAA